MPRSRRRAAAWLALGVATLAGCEAAGPLEEAGIARLEVPEGWTPAPPSDYSLPGEVKAAWAGPQGSSLVVFRNLPIPNPSPSALAQETAARWRNLPGLTVLSAGAIRVGDAEAARIEALAPGLGDRLAPSGRGEPIDPKGRELVPTHRVSVGIPRRLGTTWIVWHFPESARDAIAPQVDATLRGLVLRGAD